MEFINSITYHIEENTSINENGSVSIHYILMLYEPYSLSEKKLKDTRDTIYKSFELVCDNVYIHKTDFIQRKLFDSSLFYIYDDYLSLKEREHFNNREYYQHFCTLTFTTEPLSLLIDNSFNPFKNTKELEEKDLVFLKEFKATVKSAINLIKGIKGLSVIEIKEEELKEILFKQQNGYSKKHIVRDLKFDDKILFGEDYVSIYSFNSNSQFKNGFDFVDTDKSLNENFEGIKKAFLEDLGIKFPYNHAYHQIIKTGNKTRLKNTLDDRLQLYKSHKGYSGKIKERFENIFLFEKKISSEKLNLCKAHFSIIIYEKDEKILEKANEDLETILNSKGIIPSKSYFENAYQIFNGTLLGNEASLPDYQYFLTTFKDAQNLFTYQGDFKDDDEGLIFQNTLDNKPFRRDLIDLNRKRINARNGILVAPTGNGKSSTVLNLGTQLILDGVFLVCVEFGKSFASLVKLFPEKSSYITYEHNTPLGYNFFNLNSKELSNDKINSIRNYILKLWRLNLEIGKEKTNISTSLNKIIKDYYAYNNEEHNFPNFYKYTVENYNQIAERNNIPFDENYFDIKSFTHVLSEFTKGGAYENVTQENPKLENSIFSSQIVVIELSNIEGDPFLVSIIYTILQEVFKEKVMKDRSKLAGILLDEYGKTQGITNMAEIPIEENIHASIAQLFQVIRKELGFVWAVIQGPKQLPKNHHTENIITNTQLLMVLEGTEKVYDDIIDMFNIKNKEHINLMKSLKNNFDKKQGKNLFSSLFLRIGENYGVVVRQEFCKEKLYAFQTDGSDWDWLHKNYEKTNDFPKSIDNLIKYKDEK